MLIAGDVNLECYRSLALVAKARNIAISAEFGQICCSLCAAFQLALFRLIEVAGLGLFYLGEGNGVIGKCLHRNRGSRLGGLFSSSFLDYRHGSRYRNLFAFAAG